MKILTRTAAAVLAAVTAAAVWAVPAAAAASVQGISSTSCIADNANILSRDTETYITNISVALQENCSGAQIGVYTTDYVGNNTMEGYAYEVFQAWGLGSADQDNGMVLLMATGDDNYWATPGEGLESAFSGNVLSDLLYDNLEASWAKQDYDTGARKTVLAMAERICDVYGVSLDMDAIGSGLADSSGRIVENTQSRSNGGSVLGAGQDAHVCTHRLEVFVRRRDVVEQCAAHRRRRGRRQFASLQAGQNLVGRQQAAGRALHIALKAGDLPGKEHVGVVSQELLLGQHLGAFQKRVAVHDAIAHKLGGFQAGDHTEHPLLLAPL